MPGLKPVLYCSHLFLRLLQPGLCCLLDVWQDVCIVILSIAICCFDAIQESVCCTRCPCVQCCMIRGIKAPSIYHARQFKNFLLLTYSELLCCLSLSISFNCISVKQLENFFIPMCLPQLQGFTVSHPFHNRCLLVDGMKKLRHTSIKLKNVATLPLSVPK